MAGELRRARGFVVGVAGRLRGAQMSRTAAALSFTTALGLVPLFTVAFVWVARYPPFQQWLDALERFLLRHLLPGASSTVRRYLTDFTTKAGDLQGVSIALVVITAVLLVATVEREFNAIWGVRAPRALWRRLIVYALGIVAGPLVIGAMVWSTGWVIDAAVDFLPAAAHALPYVAPPIALATTTLAFALLHALMPSRPVSMRHAFVGGLFTALGIEVAKRLFGLYIVNVPTYQIVYGALAVLPLFLLWIYLSWVVVLVGAAVTATLAEGPLRNRRR
jgi:membrane protein